MIHLECDRVSKKYRIKQKDTEPTAFFPRLWHRLRARPKDLWAIRDLSFQVERGESFGVIGPNGAGKSTILKLLSGITAPTEGRITIRGRIAGLLEVGAGFHAELTGRENVFLSGSILGMRRSEISRKLDDIIEFAELRPFLDVPVKRYSSGMYVRLGFAVAAHLEPDILLLDEVLAVGDASFQLKCRQRIHDLHRGGTTIVFISHDLTAVEEVCGRALLLDRGQVVSTGKPEEIVALYQRMTAMHHVPDDSLGVAGERQARVRRVRVLDDDGGERPVFKTGFPMSVRLDYVAHEPLRDASLGVYFYSADNILYSQLTTLTTHGPLDFQPGSGSVQFSCPELGLQPGIYHLDAAIESAGAMEPVDRLRHCVTIRVDPGRVVRGLFYTAHQCMLEPAPSPDAPPAG